MTELWPTATGTAEAVPDEPPPPEPTEVTDPTETPATPSAAPPCSAAALAVDETAIRLPPPSTSTSSRRFSRDGERESASAK